MASETKPFYVDLDAIGFREFARTIPLSEDEALVLESYARHAAEFETFTFSASRVIDTLVARGQAENLQKFKTLANVRRLITQTAYSLRDKKFIDVDMEGGDVLRIRLTDPAAIVLEEHYAQMMSNAALNFPDEELMKRYLLPANRIDIPVSEIAQGANHRFQEEKRILVFQFSDVPQNVCATGSTVDTMLEVCYLKLRNIIVASAQNRLGEDLVKDMQNIMPQKSSSVERMLRILNRTETEIPLYFVNLANRLAAYFIVDREKRGMIPLIQAAKLVEGFKGYEAWLESEKNNEDKIRENSQKLLNVMADFPALLSRADIMQKVVNGSSGLEVMASVLNPNEIDKVVQQTLAEFSVFQADERELLPKLLKFKLQDDDFFIHREAVLIYFESERKRVRAEMLARLRRMWYALMLKDESRSSMEFDEFFADDVEKYVKNNEPIFSALLLNPQAIINAFHVISRHPVSAVLQEIYFIIGNRVIFKPVHALLELNRREIFARVRAELPFLYRYPLLRWLASLFGFIRQQPSQPETKDDTPAKFAGTVNRETDWHRALHMVETRLIGEKSGLEMIEKYADLWNIKLGDAHVQLAQRVDAEIVIKAKRLYSMTRKLPEVTQSFLSNEISNSATQLVRKFGNDAADTRAFNQYVQLSLIEQLKSIHG